MEFALGGAHRGLSPEQPSLGPFLLGLNHALRVWASSGQGRARLPASALGVAVEAFSPALRVVFKKLT